jgi:hypothetical protein
VDSTFLTAEYFAVPFEGEPLDTPFDAMVLSHRTRTIQNEMNPGITGAFVP